MPKQFIVVSLVVITGLWSLRWLISGQSPVYYGFMIWNVFLALIPLLLLPLFVRAERLHGLLGIMSLLLLGIIWLLFLPNAFYVITDFMHLNGGVLVNQRNETSSYLMYYARGDAQFLFDALLVFTGTAISAYAGGLALVKAYKQLRLRTNPWLVKVGLGIVMLLVGVGVYIGRYARWNSWDGITQPWAVVTDLGQSLGDAATRERFFLVLLTMVLFQLLSVWVVARVRFSGDTADRS